MSSDLIDNRTKKPKATCPHCKQGIWVRFLPIFCPHCKKRLP